jgi:hypothetical protein
MSEAVKLIVDSLVRLKDRQAIEDLRVHREMLLGKLHASDSSWPGVRESISLIDSDLSEIEAGLSRLQ